MHANSSKNALMRNVIILCALIFLYLPIVTLIIYSFNESRMVTVWTEASLKWYRALFNNADIFRAVGVSLTVAFMTACASVVIGTLAAFVLVRVGRFRGESLFVLLITAPMILPEVITGLALLLIFVTLSSEISIFADRGIMAIWIAHVTFCSSYATVVIRSRFRELDISIEEAAMDLGAGPVKVFFAVILPALMPSEVAAFLLAFTMSMDDLVVASFIAGPDSTTLPMLIFSSVRRGLSPEINALATIIVFIVSVFTFFAWLSMVKKQKRMRADAAKAAQAAAIEEKLHYSAPHGEDALGVKRRLDDATLAVLKEQAAALARGEDTSAATSARLREMGYHADQAAQAAAQAAAHAAAAQAAAAQAVAQAAVAAGDTSQAESTDSDSDSAEVNRPTVSEEQIEANYEAIEAAKEAAREAALKAARAAQAAAQEEALAQARAAARAETARTAQSGQTTDNDDRAAADRGASARDATAAQRVASSTLAQAGMAKVVESEDTMNPHGLENSELDGKAVTRATTMSSLADARARKAALKSARDGAPSAETVSDSSAVSTASSSAAPGSTTQGGIIGSIGARAAQGAKAAKAAMGGRTTTATAPGSSIGTTSSSLAQARARKEARALSGRTGEGVSAAEATRNSEDKAAARDTSTVKVVDNTQDQ